MFNPGGYLLIATDQGKNIEYDTFICGHCNKIVIVPPRSDMSDLGGMCRGCMKLICPKCVDKQTCTPFEKQLEKIEARSRMLRSMGLE